MNLNNNEFFTGIVIGIFLIKPLLDVVTAILTNAWKNYTAQGNYQPSDEDIQIAAFIILNATRKQYGIEPISLEDFNRFKNSFLEHENTAKEIFNELNK